MHMYRSVKINHLYGAMVRSPICRRAVMLDRYELLAEFGSMGSRRAALPYRAWSDCG